MKSKKIKVFLGGYVNYINAQNLNCRALSEHLDPERFEVSTMLFPQTTARDFRPVRGVKYIRLWRPLRFGLYWAYLRGIVGADVIYLPKGEVSRFCYAVARLLGKKSFITVEGVMDKETLAGCVQSFGSEANVRNLYNRCDRVYSITKYMSSRNADALGVRSDGILYLGVEPDTFRIADKPHKKEGEPLDFVFIGSDVKRKRLNEFLDLAKAFPEDRFHVVGGHGDDIFKTMGYDPLPNVTAHGRLTHQELSALLRDMDAHVFPSRSEGFPKVTLETAAAGVPSIVYGDYGADEWITSGRDGYVVDRFEEIVDILKDLKANPDRLRTLSVNAVEMAKRFDWKSVMGQWEEAISALAK